MTKTKILFAFTMLLLASLACNVFAPAAPTPVVIVEPTFPSQPQPGDLPATEADVPRVPLEQALTAHSAGAAVFLDVRSIDSYTAGHIPGATNIPLTDIEVNPVIPGVDKDEWIITYCTWLNEHTSARAAFILLHNGYEKVTPILGGFEAWVEAGYPVEP